MREGLLRDCQPVIRRYWLRYKAQKAAKEVAEKNRREREEAAKRRRMELEAEISKKNKKKAIAQVSGTTGGTSPPAKGTDTKNKL